MRNVKFAFLSIPLLMFLWLAGEAHSAEPTVISVTLSEFEYKPNILKLNSNATYTLRLTNTGSADHDFAAPEFFKAVKISNSSIGKVREGRIILHPGETIDLEVATRSAGAFPLHCTFLFHEIRGMKGEIDIN